jgi:glyoxylase I family protein
MPSLAGLHHTSLTVSDLDASAAWYSRVLGMVEQFREAAPHRKAAVFRFVGGAWSVGLVEHVGSPSGAFDPTVTGLDHLAFTVSSREELREWAEHLSAQGVDTSGAIEIPPGEIVNFKDPDGIALSLFWDRNG